MRYQLRISGYHHQVLHAHLLPGDGLEAVAVALCGRGVGADDHLLLVHELVLIPYDECERRPDFIHWKTDRIVPLLQRAAKYNMAIMKIHSHPGGYRHFSSLDDESDARLFASVFGWMDTDLPHGSAIMVPGGELIARVFHPDLSTEFISKISIAGDQITIWGGNHRHSISSEVQKRTGQAFGDGTLKKLRSMTIGVVGCSGTGSPLLEQLHRLEVGKLVIVDPDRVEHKNLNRIIATKVSDATSSRFKVDVFAEYVKTVGLQTEVVPYHENLYNCMEALYDLTRCDVIFGCVDSVDGRDLLNRLATYYLIPYFDLGVKLMADGNGGIEKIVGTVNFLQPGGSSLMSRGLYDGDDLKAAGLYRVDPEGFPDLVKNSYIKNVPVGRPAVISVNMMLAAYSVNEFLNRIHPYKVDPAQEYAQSTIELTESCFIHTSEKRLNVDEFLKKKVGLGDRSILLDMIELTNLYEAPKAAR